MYRTPYIACLCAVGARGRPVVAKPQNHPAVPSKGDALTIMLDEPKPLEFTQEMKRSLHRLVVRNSLKSTTLIRLTLAHSRHSTVDR